jgi:hypothetical protein
MWRRRMVPARKPSGRFMNLVQKRADGFAQGGAIRRFGFGCDPVKRGLWPVLAQRTQKREFDQSITNDLAARENAYLMDNRLFHEKSGALEGLKSDYWHQHMGLSLYHCAAKVKRGGLSHDGK